MNLHDRKNVNFLLSLDPPAIEKWYNSVSPDDVNYAVAIIKIYTNELAVKSALLTDNEVSNVDAASKLLRKFTKYE